MVRLCLCVYPSIFLLLNELDEVWFSVLAMGPMGLAAAGSGLAEDDGFLRVIKIHSPHFLRRSSKPVGPMS
jgi:hypothetical protein